MVNSLSWRSSSESFVCRSSLSVLSSKVKPTNTNHHHATVLTENVLLFDTMSQIVNSYLKIDTAGNPEKKLLYQGPRMRNEASVQTLPHDLVTVHAI